MSKQLRPYQENCIDAVFKELNNGSKTQMIVLATGLGKTKLSVDLSKGFKRTLFIVDTDTLIEQTALAFLKEKYDEKYVNHVKTIGFVDFCRKKPVFGYDQFSIGLIKADVFEPYGDLVMASMATLHRRLPLLEPNLYQCIIVDECHTAMAKTFVKGITHFTPNLLLGMTATDKRLDGLKLTDLFATKSFEYNIIDGIKDGYLVEFDAIRIKTNISLDTVKTQNGDLNEQQLANVVDCLSRNNLIADKWLQYCKGRKTIGFAVNIAHALHLVEAFEAKGIKVGVISSNEELTGDRYKTLKQFENDEIDVLWNIGLLTKGFNEPRVSCIITARPTKSETLFRQMVGRGGRVLEGIIDGIQSVIERILAIKKSDKKDCIILDVVDLSSKHDLVNCHSLDAELPLEDRVFLTSDKKDKILESRKATIENLTDTDTHVKLLKLPNLKYNKTFGSNVPASEDQLAIIEKLGYNIVDTFYSQSHINDIILNLPATKSQIKELKENNYAIDGYVSRWTATLALQQVKQ